MSQIASGDGTQLAAHAWPGGKPTLAMLHATGFCKETWAPLIDELRVRGVDNEIVVWDQRAHGDSGPMGAMADWWDLGRDALAVVDSIESPIVGIGHSSGGAALVMAELLRPGSFESLVLVEPVIFPPPHGRDEDSPLASGAMHRRASFASRAEARQNYIGKGAFANWEERAVDAFVDGCFADDGDGISLKCRPEDEAEFYRAGSAHGVWDRLGEVGVDTLIVSGNQDSGLFDGLAARQAAQFLQASVAIVPGSGHFVPMEQPAALAALVADCLASTCG